MSCGCGCFGTKPCASKASDRALADSFGHLLAKSPQYHRRVVFGDEGDPPHSDDFWVSMEDALAYAEWVDEKVKALVASFDGWLAGSPDVRKLALEWSAVGAGGQPFMQWVTLTWEPFIKKMREGSWLPFGATWTRLNSWNVIQDRHRELKAASARAAAAGLPSVPDAGNPEARGPLGKLKDDITDTAIPITWLLLAGGAFYLVATTRK